jgi:hypothetical protein
MLRQCNKETQNLWGQIDVMEVRQQTINQVHACLCREIFYGHKTVHFVKLRGRQIMHTTVFSTVIIIIWYMGTNIFETPIAFICSVKLPEDGCSRSVWNTGAHLPNYAALHLRHSSNPKNVCSVTLYLPHSFTLKMEAEGPTNPETHLPNHMASQPIQRIHHSHHCEKPKSYKITYVCM